MLSYWIGGRPLTIATRRVWNGSVAEKFYSVICNNHANLYAFTINPTVMYTISSTKLKLYVIKLAWVYTTSSVEKLL